MPYNTAVYYPRNTRSDNVCSALIHPISTNIRADSDENNFPCNEVSVNYLNFSYNIENLSNSKYL